MNQPNRRRSPKIEVVGSSAKIEPLAEPLEKEKFQIQSRTMQCVSVNHDLAQKLFSFTPDEFQHALHGGRCEFMEKTKNGAVKSYFWLKLLKDKCTAPFFFKGTITLSKPLDELDRSIFDACISARCAKAECITCAGIWHSITGNDDPKEQPTDAWKKEIAERVGKLACIRLTVDVSDAVKAKIYPAEIEHRFRGYLLPCSVVEAFVNGQLVDGVVKFLDESPLLRIARVRASKQKQLLSFSKELLDVPNQRHTPTTIRITNYIVRRVEAAKQHSNLQKSIRFETLFKQCGLAKADRGAKRDARKIVEAVMKSLVEKKEIQSFEFVKEGGQFTKITFNFN